MNMQNKKKNDGVTFQSNTLRITKAPAISFMLASAITREQRKKDEKMCKEKTQTRHFQFAIILFRSEMRPRRNTEKRRRREKKSLTLVMWVLIKSINAFRKLYCERQYQSSHLN
ncbi:CLUMA_CG016053, isoform A [Clunio marinus]|uniref:CLUMA_CG016053, isoform A n=1 Tax=Clunio marinus TaxID=568069 RepID=A0A1J1ISY4_9DIPT|nr:CLUMA_CG016053, isoform A [Clunio marinus]